MTSLAAALAWIAGMLVSIWLVCFAFFFAKALRPGALLQHGNVRFPLWKRLVLAMRMLPAVSMLSAFAMVNAIAFAIGYCWHRLRGKPLPRMRNEDDDRDA